MIHINKNIFFLILIVSFCASLQGQDRTFDGSNNNIENPSWGAAHTQLLRKTTVDYADGISSPAGQNRYNPREISNLLFEQPEMLNDKLNLSDYIWAFGQFIDHDISLVESFDVSTNPEESASIIVPSNDQYFQPNSFIHMMRSKASDGTGTDAENPRQHDNAISSFLDASMVYGSSQEVADFLRLFEDGKLKTSDGNNLPWNTIDGQFNSSVDPNAPEMETGGFSSKFYVAGDVRANENPLLLSLHTLFVREHNLICDELVASDTGLSDEGLYQLARKIVSGKLQSIVYNEWLPTLNIQLPNYTGYSPQVVPAITNVFSGAAFRLGHTLINSNIIRMQNNGDLVPTGNIALKDAFFNPLSIQLGGGIESYVKGMATQVQQDFDCKVVGDVRNFLFGDPSAGGLDLAAININRGRERGLPDYNTVRENFGLPKISSFFELCSDPVIVVQLAEIYGTVEDIDPWVGMLAENHLNDALFGELVMKILEDQFRNLRDGDRFYFDNDDAISEAWKTNIRSSTLRSIIMRNTDIELMQENVFRAMDHSAIPNGPKIASDDLVSTIYPNPVNSQFYLKVYSEGEKEVEMTIYNNIGEIIDSRMIQLGNKENNISMNVSSELETGIYIVKIQSEDKFSIARFYKS